MLLKTIAPRLSIQICLSRLFAEASHFPDAIMPSKNTKATKACDWVYVSLQKTFTLSQTSLASAKSQVR